MTGRRYCLPTVNCTSAIHLSLLALGIGKGDEVIVPDITWVGSVSPVVYVGAKPVFADIEVDTWCLSAKSFENAITKKTRAVIVVDLYGNIPRMNELLRIARKHKIAVIEDAAEGIGARYLGKPAGSFGDLSVFSFNATKLVMAGQGGALLTDNKQLYERASKLSHHGFAPYSFSNTFWCEEIGYNYQWTNIQAALALAQLKRLPELLAYKRKVFNWYKKYLRGLPGISLNVEIPRTKSTFWIANIVFDKSLGLGKERLMNVLRKNHIEPRPFFYPLSSMPAFAPYVKGKQARKKNPVSYELSPRSISLPSSSVITEKEVRYICEVIRKLLSQHRAT